MSSLGTVQRCQNPVVLPSLHGGLPPAQTMDRYVHKEYNYMIQLYGFKTGGGSRRQL